MYYDLGVKCRSLTFRYSKSWNVVQGGQKNHENILKGGFTRRKKEMPIICYELGNYYLILTNIVLNVHALGNQTVWPINVGGSPGGGREGGVTKLRWWTCLEISTSMITLISRQAGNWLYLTLGGACNILT